MSCVRFQNVSKEYDGHLVLRDVPSPRPGRTGRADRAKRGRQDHRPAPILGQEPPSQGSVEVEAGTRIGYFSQFSELGSDATVYEVLDELFADVHALEYKLLEVEEAFARGPERERAGAAARAASPTAGGNGLPRRLERQRAHRHRPGKLDSARLTACAPSTSSPAGGATARRWRSCWRSRTSF